jgi:4-hydroxybenzoyl-CoA thioesterase
VRFAHVDAAGIVYFPRYMELVSAAVEDWFAQSIGVDFRTLHLERRVSVPTVKLDCEFLAPSRLGDVLEISLRVSRLGGSSVTLQLGMRCGAQDRARVNCVLVCMDMVTGRAQPWPGDIRGKMAASGGSGGSGL